jgi:6-pyruvoyltetrahydropterin/6-carboxytetrahydropterin synthase
MGQWLLRKTVEIDAAHFLPKYDGKCREMHGHRWKVTVEIRACELDSQGMIFDFAEISKVVKEYDHKVINDFVMSDDFQPTSEVFAAKIASDISAKLDVARASLIRVIVEETPGSVIEFCP